MSIERKADHVLQYAKTRAEKVGSWAEFSAELFDQFRGIVAKTFPSDMERQAFYDTEQYKQLLEIQVGLMQKFGVVAGAAPKKSGRFVVRVPKTMHQKLEIEAKDEGVSLNQLAVAKLSLPLPRPAGAIESVLIEAFNDVHDGHSPDWVIIDPRLNDSFLSRCRRLGLKDPPYKAFQLNHRLMHIRKTAKFAGRLNPSKIKSGFSSYDDCAFAAEIAVRTLQRTEGVTLDRILCDPELRERYDGIAQRLAPDATVIKLRSAALNLRKTHRLKPADLSSDVYELVSAGPVKSVLLSSIATMPGMYAFYDRTRPLFAGETDNLHRRIETHLRSGLPEWLEAGSDEGVTLKVATLPTVSRETRLSWLGAFINRERPLLNYQNAA